MATIERIQAKLALVQAHAQKLIAQKAQLAVDTIRAMMLEHGLTTEDIETKAKEKRDAAALKLATKPGSGTRKVLSGAKKKSALPAKYLDPKTGKTWSGRGPTPAWLASTRSKNKFLIDAASASVEPAAETPAKATRKTASAKKGHPKGVKPVKYLDPKTGKTWSGRGPTPGWLASVRNKDKFLVDGAATPVAAEPAAKKVSAKKVSAKKSAGTTGAAKKGQRKGTQPVKYLDPATGNSWSGRGPAPAWLAAVADRDVFLVG